MGTERYVEGQPGMTTVHTTGVHDILATLPNNRSFPTVPVRRWGKDHWSMLGYIECRVIANGGRLYLGHLRINPDKHPGMAHVSWKEDYPTRLKEDGRLAFHDDIDCLEDLAVVGYVLDGITGIGNGLVALTELGKQVCEELRRHKGDGKNFHSFMPSDGLIPEAGR